MATVTRAYVSRMAGLTVFDPNGDRVGKVRDVVVALRVGSAPPRALGLIIDANRAFLDLVELPAKAPVLGQQLGRWLGRPGADLAVVLDALRGRDRR